jgi:cell wall-associated NlpC family hydrolase
MAMAGLAFVLLALLPAVAAAVPPPLPPGPSGGALPVPVVQPPPVPGAVARLAKDGRTAIPPVAAPQAVKQAIYAANKITRRPYRYGGGHRSFEDSAYDCSGSVSYALHGAGILRSPLHSSAFMRWGEAGRGAWITVYTNPSHAYVVIAGLRFDTSGPGETGPRWRRSARTSGAFRARHPVGF